MRLIVFQLLVSPRQRKPYKIDKEKLKDYIKNHPDNYLREIAKVFGTSITAISKACKRLKITRKKPPFYKERDEEKRKSFIKMIEDIPENNRVYVDESGINNVNMGEHSEEKKHMELYLETVIIEKAS